MFVGNAFARTKFAYHGGYFRVVTVMNARKEMVFNLIIEATIEPAQEWSAHIGR